MNKIKSWDKPKKAVLLLNLLFFAALLGFSVTFFMNNITWEPNNAPIEAAYAHIGQGKAIYRIGLGATGIYKIGHLALLYFFLTKKITFSLPQILLYFAAQAGGILLCTVPFGLLDPAYAVINYLEPLLNMVVFFGVLIVFMAGVQIHRNIKGS